MVASKIIALALPVALATCAQPCFAAVASWYSPESSGSHTASGERFTGRDMTAAHRTLPFGTQVRVCHGSACVVVRINDRGPFVRGRDIDLSRAAAMAIGCGGVCAVTIERL